MAYVHISSSSAKEAQWTITYEWFIHQPIIIIPLYHPS
jgi:hypothetical protein